MGQWYLCLTPDWARNASGLFRFNSPIPGTLDFRFWHNVGNGLPDQALGNPPAPNHQASANPDQVYFAIEATPPAAPDFRVTNILVSCSPKGNGGANQASPFRDGGKVDCAFNRAPAGPVVFNGRNYFEIGPLDVFQDPGSIGGGRSRYELTVVATVEDLSNPGTYYEFSLDPEMDVQN